MKNPFYFGKEVSGEAFTNRKREIEELAADIEQGINIIVFSPRRYGKTSLIKKVEEILKKRGILICHLDLFPVANLKDLIKVYTRAIAEAENRTKLIDLGKQLGKILPRLLPKVVLKPKGGAEIIFDFERIFREKEAVIDDLLEAVHKLANKKKCSAAVVFDEFQEIAQIEGTDNLEKKIRAHIQKHQNVSYVFMGSKRHLMQEMFKNKSRPLYNCGRHFPLSKISEADFAKFIEDLFSNTGFKIGQSEIASILKITECHPYYTQLFCHLLWDNCREIKKISIEDIKKTLNQLLREEGSSYSTIWEDLSAVQKTIIKALAQDESLPLYSHGFLYKYSINSYSAIQKALRTLEKKEIIERNNGRYVISDLFLKKWLFQLSEAD